MFDSNHHMNMIIEVLMFFNGSLNQNCSARTETKHKKDKDIKETVCQLQQPISVHTPQTQEAPPQSKQS